MQRSDRNHANQDDEETSMKWRSKVSSRLRTQSIGSSQTFLFGWETLRKIKAHLDPIGKGFICFASFRGDENPSSHRSTHIIKWLDMRTFHHLIMVLWIDANDQI